jgi:multisubunit Na+/H+ antiporter MnhE subunit
MGLSGAVGLVYILAIGGDLNGPTIGALFSIVGFAAFGKHPRNILPIIAGVFLGSLVKPWGVADPSVQLAALFGTNLAPIAGYFGWHWGIVAGFVHSSAALSVGVVHGGLNLYNNGFAAGIVASILVPVILAIRARGSLTGRKPASGAVTLGASEPSVRKPTKKISESVGEAQTGAGLTHGDDAGSRLGVSSPSGADDHVAHKQAAQAVALGRGRWLGAVLLRALFFLIIWLLLSAPDLGALRTLVGGSTGAIATGFGAEIGAGAEIAADVVIGAGAGVVAGAGIGDGINAQLAADLAIALIATAMATWISLWILPPGPRPWRLSALMALIGRFLVQSVLGCIDVARRAFDPRLPLRPGYIVFATSLRRPHQRAILQTFASASPGAIAAGTDAEGRLVFHCLDTRGPIAEGLAQDEHLLLRLYREEASQ